MEKYTTSYLKNAIENMWDATEPVQEQRSVLLAFLDKLDQGGVRIATRIESGWIVNEWVKKGILMVFKTTSNLLFNGEFQHREYPGIAFDKIPSKFEGWGFQEFFRSKIRTVPGMFVRKGAYIGHNVVVMSNAFVNIGAHVDEGSMIDSCTTIGSCAQIGKRCHISSNVMIGGVLEPLQATPVIIENDCFIGAGSVLSEGIIVGEGAVLGTGVQIGASTKIVNRETGEIMYGYIPPYSVVVPGSFITEAYGPGLSLQCAVIVKTVDAVTREKTAINSLLRDAARA